jgi:hypothetical protein
MTWTVENSTREVLLALPTPLLRLLCTSADVMLALVHTLLDNNATTAAAIVERQGVQ